MLAAKFIVPVARTIRTNIFKHSLRNNKQCGNALCEKLRNVREEEVLAKCKEYQEKLAKCPKQTNEKRCSKKQTAKPSSKCKGKNVADDYQKVYQDVTKQADVILKNVRNASKSMLTQLTRGIELSRNNEQIPVRGIFHDIKMTVQKLLAVDPSFGSVKRKSAMMLNHETRQAFDNVDCDVVARVKRINAIIESLERDVQVCIGRAKTLISSCRKCKNSQALAKCVEEAATYAGKILEKTSRDVQAGLDRIESLQRGILKYHEESLTNVSQTCRERGEAFLQHLNDCVSAVKNGKKRPSD